MKAMFRPDAKSIQFHAPKHGDPAMKHILRQTLAALALAPAFALAQVPAGYPANYAATIDAAKKEGKVVVYSTTDTASAKALIDDFKQLYPGVQVEYNDMNSTEVYNRFIAEKAAGGSADVLWSSSMDLQIKLANAGGAMEYASPEVSHLPTWAESKNQAYGTTSEPHDIVKSGVGFMLINQDSKDMPNLWEFVKELGTVQPRVQSSAGTMMERIS